jgi:hypothetical protein
MSQEDLLALLAKQRSNNPKINQHDWQRDARNGNPILVCDTCGWVWLPDQNPNRIGRCDPERKARNAEKRRSARRAPHNQAEGQASAQLNPVDVLPAEQVAPRRSV